MSKANSDEFYESEMRKTIACIRHEHTNYDRLASFYSLTPGLRHALNRTIGALIQGHIDIPEFHAQVKQIERKVDLTDKTNQKRFIKTFKQRIVSSGKYDSERATKIAKSKVRYAIKFSQLQQSNQIKDMTPLFKDNHIFGNRPS